MLERLYVKNLALIEEAQVEFGSGLNILSGETGAGKSILIGSINLALGGKANSDFIRSGEESAYVELEFSLNTSTKEKLLELGLDFDFEQTEELILSRKLSPKRSVSRLNGEVISVGDIKKIAGLLIDIHGQHEHQSLLYKNHQLDIIDYFAKDELNSIKIKLKKKVQEYHSIISELEQNSLPEEERARKVDFFAFEINEIEEASLIPGEDVKLDEEFRELSQAETVRDEIAQALSFLSDANETGARANIGHAISSLSRGSSSSAEKESYLEELRTVEDLLSGTIRGMEDYLDNFNFDQEKLKQCSERIDFIQKLKTKYGSSIEAIEEYLADAREQLEQLEHQNEQRAELLKEKDKRFHEISTLCKKLSTIRKKQAKVLQSHITEALLDLNFLDVRFEIPIIQKEVFTENGWDETEFLISTNVGESVKPLAKIASGGELSRIMLAIKSVLAGQDNIEALIFDEIDTGISGRTAQMVSQKLATLSREHQILCITHLPQIAAMADQHFEIKKGNENQRTVTRIQKLSEEESVHELARILGGVEITDAVIENAREMKALANESKK